MRSIPTHVGFTPVRTEVGPNTAVHPHARGVYGLAYCQLPAGFGPSPRTWGLRPLAGAPDTPFRSIPTHVGFTTCAKVSSARTCGPSPRTWGLHSQHLRYYPKQRSIPTHVGFTQAGDWEIEGRAVHPHARGVYLLCGAIKSCGCGPSPRTWGLRNQHIQRYMVSRSIPTHVGFTQ